MNNMKFWFILIFAVIWVIFWPIAVIWALNTLFSLSIVLNFWNWLSVIVLVVTLGMTLNNKK